MREFTETQLRDIEYFKSHLKDFLANPLLADKYVVISGQQIKSNFDTVENAVKYATDTFKLGDYIIQRIFDESKVINFVKAAVV